jgi:hypothetical protein
VAYRYDTCLKGHEGFQHLLGANAEDAPEVYVMVMRCGRGWKNRERKKREDANAADRSSG